MPQRWARRAALGAALVLLILGLVACATRVESPSPIEVTPSNTSSTPTASPALTASPVPPVVVCADPPVAPTTTLTCDGAVRAALSALPAEHPLIERIEFFYGGYCPPFARCGYVSPQHGVVIFRASNADQDLGVSVLADATGAVSIVGTVGPYPPPFASDNPLVIVTPSP